MPNIISPDTNPASLRASGLYMQVFPPAGYARGVPTDVVVVVGTGSWGELNKPIYVNSPRDIPRKIGGISAAALTDIHDLATSLTLAFAQAQGQSTMQAIAIRVSDGTDLKATKILQDSAGTPANGITLTAKHSGVRGNDIKVKISDGGLSGTHNVAIIAFEGGDDEVFRNIPSAGAGVFWSNLLLAINNGQSGIRGPSQLVTASAASATAIAPAEGTFSLAGGTDGRSSVGASQLIGSESAKTGIYAVRGVKTAPSLLWLAGDYDDTTYAALDNFASSESVVALLALPPGTDTDAAIAAKQSAGLDNHQVILLKDHVYFFDPVNNRNRLVAPTAVVGGRIATLPPHISPLNKAVFGIRGTERFDPETGDRPYDLSEIGRLEDAGIMFIARPCPGGDYFGIRSGQNTSGNPAQAGVEYARLTNFLVRALDSRLGKFVGEGQSKRPNDPLRNAVRNEQNSLLLTLREQNVIEDFFTQCDLDNNPLDDIEKGFLRVHSQVTYFSTVRFLISSILGGNTVRINISALGGSQLP